MKAESMSIAGHGIEVPDDIQIDSEFDLRIRVRVFGLKRDLIDVTSFQDSETKTLPEGLHVELIALAGEQL